MKELTVVTNVYMQASIEEACLPETADTVGCGLGSRLLEGGKGYFITMNADNKLVALFEAEEKEDTAYKITFTGLKPLQKFILTFSGEKTVREKYANRVGVIEFRILLPQNSYAVMSQSE